MKTSVIFSVLLMLALLAADAQERGFIVNRREAKDHIALVIGNSAYPDAPLANPANDATDVARVFTEMGFIVDKVIDADKEQMAQAIARFSQKLPNARAAVFYYAGHGVQVNGENYLLPIGNTPATQITAEDQVPYRAINAGEILAAMEQAKVNFNMVVLDACRNNPFKGSGRGKVPGLASVNAPVGSLVMYATKAGSVAADGQNSRNSPFTTAFLKHIQTPGLDVNLLPSKITQTVGDLTNGNQVPGTYMQLKSSFTFVPELTPDELKAMKQSQLTGLQAMNAELEKQEAEMARRKAEDDAMLARKQADIDALDKQIAALRAKTSSSSVTSDTDLDQMLAFVKQKEAQKKELEELQRQAEESRIAREKELENLKQKTWDDRNAQIDADINKYNQIAGSEFGQDMAQAAWDNILLKYGLPKSSIEKGNEYTLKYKINPAPCGGINSESLAMITGGTFTMGSPNIGNDEYPHTVKVGSFNIMKYEVTFTQYDVYCDATGKQKPADNGWGRWNRPVINVSWNDANDYARWLSQISGKTWRLPTEAEWEYAAKGGQDYTYSGSNDIDNVAWYFDNSSNQTHPLGQKKSNQQGIYDMTGNVWEWCADWYSSDYYINSPANNPKGPLSGSSRVLRGGGWCNTLHYCNIAYRSYNNPDYRSNFIGFRLVLVP